MKYLLLFYLILLNNCAQAQLDSARNVPVPENRETSYESGEIWIIALIGLIVLISLYFLFRRMRKIRS